MDNEQRLYFRDSLREARAHALKDAEGFMGVVHCLETLGVTLSDEVQSLGKYEDQISRIASESLLASTIPHLIKEWHVPFSALYDELRVARNDTVHQGASARLLTNHAVHLALILEDALMSDAHLVSQFMVRNPVCAALWQPVSFVRQVMLANGFSYVPVLRDSSWSLIPECSIARYLRSARRSRDRRDRLATTVEAAISSGNLETWSATVVLPETLLADLIPTISAQPILVARSEMPSHLLGILTASDVL